MIFFSELEIEKFRGIKNLKIDSLNHINLIVGDNNCGKTSVLEAIQFFKTAGGLTNIYKIARQRDYAIRVGANSIYDNIMCMFPRETENMEISIKGVISSKKITYKICGKQDRVLINEKDVLKASHFQYDDISNDMETDAFYGTIFWSEGEKRGEETIDIARFSSVSRALLVEKDVHKIVYVAPFEHLKGNVLGRIIPNEGYKSICLEALRLFDAEIEDMMLFRSDIGNRPVEYLRHRRLGDMPISTYGDGIKKVLVLANAIARAAGGILLIDEIETAIHKKYYDDIFKFIVKACKAFDVQVFITSHSIEAIDGILATQNYAEQEQEDDINVITLKQENNCTYSRVLSGRTVVSNRESFGFEVRL